MSDEPLIYTSKGNIPVSELIREEIWDESGLSVKILPVMKDGSLTFNAKLSGYITCSPTYYINENGEKGELVRNDVYVYHMGIDENTEVIPGNLN